jgi:transcriptional regulator with XRE-family HTH domain
MRTPGSALTDMAEETAEQVRAMRMAAGLSIRELARRSGLSPSTITRIEAGAVDPGIRTLRQLAAAAGSTLHLSYSHPYPTAPTTAPHTVTMTSATSTTTRQPKLASLSDALRTTPAGTGPDWTRLRAFVDWARRHPTSLPAALAPSPAASGDHLLDNLLAAIAEKLSDDAGLPQPAWTSNVAPLEQTWRVPLRGAAAQRERDTTPPQLLRRRIELGEANLWRDPEQSLIHNSDRSASRAPALTGAAT